MPLANALIAELEQEGKSTLRMLERLPMDKLDWMPHPKSLTLGRLAWHVVAIPALAVGLIDAGRFDITNAGPPPMPENPEFVETFRGNLKAIRAKLAEMDDVALKTPFAIVRDGDELMHPPTIVFLRQIMMNHQYHHRGQLSVYLRLLDVPLPAIYGTSADEVM
ncbi:MAG TPA: DinB family protein [Thermoanaerobaculia bacterium]